MSLYTNVASKARTMKVPQKLQHVKQRARSATKQVPVIPVKGLARKILNRIQINPPKTTPLPTAKVEPAPRTPLPGVTAIVARPSAGGAPPPTHLEQTVALYKKKAAALRLASPNGWPLSAAHYYATQPRKDGTTSALSVAQNPPLADSLKAAEMDASQDESASGPLHWTALLVIAGIAWALFIRK
jgi:hypothetical protein